LTSTKICIALPGYSTNYILEKTKIFSKNNPDLIEVRLDYMKSELDISLIREKIEIPLIATNRRSDQGGLNNSKEEKRIALLIEAAQSGWNYIDVSIITPILKEVSENVHKHGAKLIASYHDFRGTPNSETFKKIYLKALRVNADICKIVGTANTYEDNFLYLDFLKAHPKNVSFAMGKYGTPSRVLSALMGGAFTYASAESGMEVAPGQISIKNLKTIYKLLGGEK
jgi:3-dehydroquinate dehydratase/shikimate dehydrogenase